MKLSDYVVQYLVDRGIKKVFLLTGGACAHIVDSLGKNNNISYVCVQHEQAAAMAADAYAKMTNGIGVAVATSGPGATNLITGVSCSFFDSIPTLILTGQVNLWETKGNQSIRQLGFQETAIIDIIKPITKFAVLVKNPNDIRYFLDKATHIATSGRPGPVWLDIPVNVQHADISLINLKKFTPKKVRSASPFLSIKTIQLISDKLLRSTRPVIIVGAGIKISQAEYHLAHLLRILNAPAVLTWSGIDTLPHTHRLNIGPIGVYGSRAANFAVQNSDLVLSIGSRLDTRQTGGQPKTFAREATKIVVDICEAELNKNWVKADIPVCADATDFLRSLNSILSKQARPNFSEWLSRCISWKEQYPCLPPKYCKQAGSVNAYVFMDALSKRISKNSTITIDNGGVTVLAIQGLKIKKGQRIVTALGHAPMGYALPAAIGASFANPKSDIICLIGDGGIQLTIQELQTVVKYNLPIKIFVLNNNAYGIIKQFQEIYFDGRHEATVDRTGYSAPNFVKIADAYGIASSRITNYSQIDQKIDYALGTSGPIMCDVKLDADQKLIPKLIAIRTSDGRYISKPLEDMSPLLPRAEFRKNMIITPLPE